MHGLVKRPRRLRRSPGLRSLVRETRLSVTDLVYPYFVRHGEKIRRPVPSMPGIHQFSLDEYIRDLDETISAGIPAVILFGIPEEKDELGTEGYADDGIIPVTIRKTKEVFPELVVIADLCLCEYTSHGHCGIVRGGDVRNDDTLELYSKAALAYAWAGADIIAPSGMMDGQVGAIRSALDDAGHDGRSIMAYSAKYASSFYGPFRDAAESPPRFGDRKTYQMDPSNAVEGLREVRLDIEEGADIVMVKPALPYLDMIRRVKEISEVPVAAYQVSGEYSMIKAAAERGWMDEEKTVLEALTSIRRAGADIVITYFAREIAPLIR